MTAIDVTIKNHHLFQLLWTDRRFIICTICTISWIFGVLKRRVNYCYVEDSSAQEHFKLLYTRCKKKYCIFLLQSYNTYYYNSDIRWTVFPVTPNARQHVTISNPFTIGLFDGLIALHDYYVIYSQANIRKVRPFAV